MNQIREDIKRYIRSLGVSVWGRGFETTNSIDDAAEWFDQQMDGYFDYVEERMNRRREIENFPHDAE